MHVIIKCNKVKDSYIFYLFVVCKFPEQKPNNELVYLLSNVMEALMSGCAV